MFPCTKLNITSVVLHFILQNANPLFMETAQDGYFDDLLAHIDIRPKPFPCLYQRYIHLLFSTFKLIVILFSYYKYITVCTCVQTSVEWSSIFTNHSPWYINVTCPSLSHSCNWIYITRYSSEHNYPWQMWKCDFAINNQWSSVE